MTDQPPQTNSTASEVLAVATGEIRRLQVTLDQVLALAADLTTQADQAEVGSDEYVDLHTIAARIRAAATRST